ncbi:hypothetical protein TcasGA2_TC011500 [Tribolium castaneum]|uniref:Reverse transcriptase domain-containing protein n=1 Tax=Tribolium castaneum TaxID=7070 RepID=D7ELH0_TRICA|nr:hypothetical protein TcasGA2_TC011500 [Tribolium castaneum]
MLVVVHICRTSKVFNINKNTQSTRKLIGAGVPQSSVLGPSLFNNFINDIPTFAKTKTALYADDTAVYASSFSAQIASKQIQININLLEKFYDKWKIKINAEKTQIVFTRKFTDHKIGDKLRVYDKKITDEPVIMFRRILSHIELLEELEVLQEDMSDCDLPFNDDDSDFVVDIPDIQKSSSDLDETISTSPILIIICICI